MQMLGQKPLYVAPLAWMQVLGLLLGVVASGCTANVNPEQAKAIAEIEKLGGKVTFDEKSREKSVIGVNLSGTTVTDAGLEHLKGLTQLQELSLTDTKVSGAGLEHLKELTNLQRLDLMHTEVTDAGLEGLKELTNLKGLNLWGTKVTDAGLERLRGLTKLQWLNLLGTAVTADGVRQFQQALPNCKIVH
jgi:uncharacterized protein YjbI with pentapeptide repeats